MDMIWSYINPWIRYPLCEWAMWIGHCKYYRGSLNVFKSKTSKHTEREITDRNLSELFSQSWVLIEYRGLFFSLLHIHCQSHQITMAAFYIFINIFSHCLLTKLLIWASWFCIIRFHEYEHHIFWLHIPKLVNNREKTRVL